MDDFPMRLEMFVLALSDLSEADINAGFELSVSLLKEFPTPAHIREFAMQANLESSRRLTEQRRLELKQLEDRNKDARFDETDLETRRKEFAEMLAEVARKKGMP
jgi:hypothetical protein